jgi:speckle-type POZ protein
MFNDSTFTDFELKCSDGKVLKAHKVILVARSPVFHAILLNDMKEAQQGFAEVFDFDSTVMKEVLRFIYSNQVEGLEKISNRLIFAAEKFQLEGLKEMCIDNIVANLSPKNVLRCLRLADRVSNSKKLVAGCIETAIK